MPDSQFAQYQTALEVCEAPFLDDVLQIEDFTAAQWTQLYSLEMATAECLRNENIDVPEVPSEQSFIELYQSPEPWTSYGFVGDVGESK